MNPLYLCHLPPLTWDAYPVTCSQKTHSVLKSNGYETRYMVVFRTI